MTHPYPPHLTTFSYLGMYSYALCFRTASNTEPFTVAAHVDLVRAQFVRASTEKDMEITAYCFMPDHVHLLVLGTRQSSDGRAFINAAKQYSGYYFKQETGRTLWQRYCYERALRSEFERASTIRYILDNPLRAGLARRVEDYPYLGSEKYTIAELIAQATPSDKARIPIGETSG